MKLKLFGEVVGYIKKTSSARDMISKCKAVLNIYTSEGKQTKQHSEAWKRFKNLMDRRSIFAAPFVLLVGIFRLTVFNGGQAEGEPILKALYTALVVRRVCWIALIIVSCKYRKLCRCFHSYEMLAMVLDSLLAL